MRKIPWWEPVIGTEEQKYIKKVLDSAFPNEGPLTIEFQNKIAGLIGAKYAIAVPNATSAMYLSLKALGIGFGDEVIVPDLTFIATAHAVEMTGAKPVLCDVDPDTLTIDMRNFEKLITKKTKAVIPVHVSGRGADMKSLLKIAKKNNVLVVEDAAEALLSKKDGKYLGTFGITGCFSFSPAKVVTTGQGGVIVTNNTKVYKKLIELKDQGRDKRGTGGDDIHVGLGFNFKFTDLQAAMGLGQLTMLAKRAKVMRQNHEIYRNALSKITQIKILPFDTKNGELPLWTDAICENRNKLDKFLQLNGADCRRFWHPIHTQAYYKKSKGTFTVASKLSPLTLWLPSAFTLKRTDILFVVSLIKQFYGYK